MILGIGTDIVVVDRFERWINYSAAQLQKIFTNQELDDCRFNDNTLSAQKLAVRFTAKEAFYKALSAALVNLGLNKKEFSLLSTCPHVAVISGDWGVPVLQVDWQILSLRAGVSLQPLTAHLSLSHEKTMAIAFVVISQPSN